MIDKLLPPRSLRRKVVKKLVRTIGYRRSLVVADYYNVLTLQKREYIPLQPRSDLNIQPLISIVIPVFNTPKRYLMSLIYSVVSQTYSNWELILVDASTEDKIKHNVAECANIDIRIKRIEVENKGISVNTNEGIKIAKGDYIAFCDHDDILEENALYEVARALNLNPQAGLIYTDEDKISDDGRRYFSPHFKPDWSPDLLLNVNYITHLVVVKRSLVEKIGPLDPVKDGAQDYDFLLRIADEKPQIIHIPQVLYHWREAANSTAKNFENKPSVTRAAKSALEQHLARNNIKATVKVRKNKPGFYRINYEAPKQATIIVTPFTSNSAIMSLFIELLITKTTTDNDTQITFVLPTSIETRVKPPKNNMYIFKFVLDDDKYLDTALNTLTSKAIIINSIVLPRKKDWLNGLLGPLQFKRISAVAPIILNNSNWIEDAGLVKQDSTLISLFRNALASNNLTYFGATDWDRNVDALTGAIAAIHTKELMAFMQERESGINNPRELIRDYTSAMTRQGKHTLLSGGVRFDNHAIHLGSIETERTFGNPNLQMDGGGATIITPEGAIETILLHLKDIENDKRAFK